MERNETRWATRDLREEQRSLTAEFGIGPGFQHSGDVEFAIAGINSALDLAEQGLERPFDKRNAMLVIRQNEPNDVRLIWLTTTDSHQAHYLIAPRSGHHADGESRGPAYRWFNAVSAVGVNDNARRR